jgi:hypothetical protein
MIPAAVLIASQTDRSGRLQLYARTEVVAEFLPDLAGQYLAAARVHGIRK